jgi:hypothetical protein
MLPILPFAAGLLAGAAAIGLLRSERTRAKAAQLQAGLRQAGASGFDAAKRGTQALRARFASPATAVPADTPAAAPAPKQARRTAKPAAAKNAAKAKAPAKPRAKAKAKSTTETAA